jgi:hypothetical protein
MEPLTGLQSNCESSEKHSSLLRFGINYTRKMCYNIEPWGDCYDFFTLGIYAINTYCFVQLVKLR